jgi:hypothetical protein
MLRAQNLEAWIELARQTGASEENAGAPETAGLATRRLTRDARQRHGQPHGRGAAAELLPRNLP